MNYVIGRKYRFESAHQLRNVAPGHKCASMHGHTYTVEVRMESGELDKAGMVMDFFGIDLVMECLLRLVDHKVLNHLPTLEQNPTAENIAAWFGGHLVESFNQPVSVRVYENPDCWAEWRAK